MEDEQAIIPNLCIVKILNVTYFFYVLTYNVRTAYWTKPVLLITFILPRIKKSTLHRGWKGGGVNGVAEGYTPYIGFGWWYIEGLKHQ